MRHNHSKHRVEIPVTAMRQRFVAAAVRDAENSMSKKRFFGTFLSLSLCLIFGYASFFYVPAYIDLSMPIGLSTPDKKLPVKSKETGKLANYLDIFTMRRGYLSKGQHLILNYDLSPGVTVSAAIGRCSSPPIIEVFYCHKIDEKRFKVRTFTSGSERFSIQKPGFYYFDEIVTDPDGTETTKPFRITWSRGKLSSRPTETNSKKKAPLKLRSLDRKSASR